MSRTTTPQTPEDAVNSDDPTPSKRRPRAKVDATEKLSSLEQAFEIKETPKEALQRGSLKPIVWFFILYNLATIGFICYMAYLEVTYKLGIITDKVLIAVIAGITIQTSSIIIAAFKGLFK